MKNQTNLIKHKKKEQNMNTLRIKPQMLLLLAMILLSFQSQAQDDGDEAENTHTESGEGGTLTPGDVEMPVDLQSFTVTQQKELGITVKWVTTAEIDHAYFTLQVSQGDTIFRDIFQVYGEGNAFEHKNYSYIDNPSASGYYLYRLVQVDIDGTTTIYPPKGIYFSQSNQLLQPKIWPNPFTDIVCLEIPTHIVNNSIFNVYVYSSVGELVYQIKTASDYNMLKIDLSFLKTGFYTLLTKEGLQEFRAKVFKE
jgi:hypothetical protein